MSKLKVKPNVCHVCKKSIKWNKDVGTCECHGKQWKPFTLGDGSNGWNLLPGK